MHHLAQTQSQALLSLLSMDNDTPKQTQRYHTQSDQLRPLRQRKIILRHRSGKENKQNLRRQVLPKLESKTELKKVLKKLEQTQEGPLRMVSKSREGGKTVVYRNTRAKPTRPIQWSNRLPESSNKQPNNMNRQQKYANSSHLDCSQYDRERGQQLRQLMRRNNYSSNALNVKTLSILQQLYSRPCYSSSKNYDKTKTYKGRTLVAFLRR